jgi:hypothetical protein
MATIKRNEKRLFRIALVPYVTIFPGIIVLVVRSSGSKVFVFVEVFQFTLQELVNDTPNIGRFITQDVRDATSPPDRHAGKGQPMRGQFCPANELADEQRSFICPACIFEPYAKYNIRAVD